MEFRIAKTEFLRGLRLAQGIADRKSTMPMLANVLLRTQGKNQLLVAATDLNVSLTAELKNRPAHGYVRRVRRMLAPRSGFARSISASRGFIIVPLMYFLSMQQCSMPASLIHPRSHLS